MRSSPKRANLRAAYAAAAGLTTGRGAGGDVVTACYRPHAAASHACKQRPVSLSRRTALPLLQWKYASGLNGALIHAEASLDHATSVHDKRVACETWRREGVRVRSSPSAARGQ